MMRVSIITGEIFLDPSSGVPPESGDRLRIALSGVPEGVRWRDPEPCTDADLARVHGAAYLRWLEGISRGERFLDMNTFISPSAYRAAHFAAGSAVAAAGRALAGETCFAMVRPPGHHAEPDRAMGFCLFNNAAIAAAWALQHADRVAILDWDLHHGNGTQRVFYGSDQVLFCSVHQQNAFPFTGWVDEIGRGPGRGYTLNAPLPQGASLGDYHHIFSQVFCRAIARFRPDLLIISAGQDTLWDDPQGRMQLAAGDFSVLTRLAREAAGCPLALILEGGYGPSHGAAIAAIFQGLEGGGPPGPVAPPRPSTREVAGMLQKVGYF
jgi:acetoin utilization deacetylase AcuC-like enzyme